MGIVYLVKQQISNFCGLSVEDVLLLFDLVKNNC